MSRTRLTFGLMLQGAGSHMNAWRHPSNPTDASVNLDFFIRNARKAPGEDLWEGGKILDPENGREYTLRLKPINGGQKLQVRGYIGPFSFVLAGSFSGTSVMMASVSSSTLATETAFSSATRTTLAGSTMPASKRST